MQETDFLEQNNKRVSWDEYFLEIARLVSSRSTCMRRKVGAVLVKDKHIISTGYNGAPSGLTHCETIGCMREKNNIPSGKAHEMCRGIHAEQNALIQSSLHGGNVESSTLYCTTFPCSLCAKLLINAKIKEIVYSEGYPDELSKTLLAEAEIEIRELRI